MLNYVQTGNVLQFTATSAISSGDVVDFDGFHGISITDLSSGETGNARITGVIELAKDSSVFTQGCKLYWSGSALTITRAGNKFIGFAWESALTGDGYGKVVLKGNQTAFENECSWKTATVSAAEASAGTLTVDMNLGVVPSVYTVQVLRSDLVVTSDAKLEALTGSDAGKLKVSDGSSYSVTENDVVMLFAGK